MKYHLPQKPHLLKIIPPDERSIVIKGDDIPWNNPWHFHPEIELLYCIKGKGTNFIGNYIAGIDEGELLLMGKNLPHTRQRDRNYYKNHPDEKPESIVVQFQEDFMGKTFFDIGEFKHIQSLLARAERGLRYFGSTRDRVVQRLHQISKADETSSIIEFLHVLDELARSVEFEFMNAGHFYSDAPWEESVRINMIYRYSVDHFHEQILLEDVASVVNFSVPSFCRFFKSRTRKTYIQYLTELRVGYACKMLMEGYRTVSDVCYACGFNNLSHFHKQFKNIKGMTPGQYRKWGSKKLPLQGRS